MLQVMRNKIHRGPVKRRRIGLRCDILHCTEVCTFLALTEQGFEALRATKLLQPPISALPIPGCYAAGREQA
jgi:hypothetical protein